MTPAEVLAVAKARSMRDVEWTKVCATAALKRPGLPSGNCTFEANLYSTDRQIQVTVIFYQDLPSATTRMIAVSVLYQDSSVKTHEDWLGYEARLHSRFGAGDVFNDDLVFCESSKPGQKCIAGAALGFDNVEHEGTALFPEVQVDATLPWPGLNGRRAMVGMIDYGRVKVINNYFGAPLNGTRNSSNNF